MESVSRETEERLRHYLALLEKWQPKINLISNNTLESAWERHFEDSLQLLPLLPDVAKTIFDFGVGAGFPGLVLAMARPDIHFHLVESDQKKCSFMRTVSRETQTQNVTIHNCRIEAVSRETIPDIIMARALANLPDLFDYCADWIASNPALILIFPKGERAEEELALLAEKWKYTCRTSVSKTDGAAKILIFSDICRV